MNQFHLKLQVPTKTILRQQVVISEPQLSQSQRSMHEIANGHLLNGLKRFQSLKLAVIHLTLRTQCNSAMISEVSFWLTTIKR